MKYKFEIELTTSKELSLQEREALTEFIAGEMDIDGKIDIYNFSPKIEHHYVNYPKIV